MRNAISSICVTICLFCAIAAIAAALVWAPPCNGALELSNGNMAPMKCAYATKEGILLAALVAFGAVVSYAKKDALILVAGISLALALISMQTPVSFGMCSAQGMACGATGIWFSACGCISAVFAIVGIVCDQNRKRVRE